MRHVAVLIVVFALAPAVAAPPTEAQKTFQEGTRLFEKGRFAEAADRFEAAFELDQNHAYLFNAAVAYERAGNIPDALRLYEKFAVFSDNRVRVATVRDTMRELEARLGRTHARLKVDVDPPGSYVFLDGGTKPLSTPFERWMPAGRHELVVKRPGFETVTQTFELAAGEPRTVRVNLSSQKVFGRVMLQATNVLGASVLLDGTPVGVTPVMLTLQAGPHTLRLESPGFAPLEHALDVEKDTDLALSLTLVRALDVAPKVPDVPREAPPPSLVKQWWFWTAVGVVVAGTAATVAVLVTRDPGETPVPAPTGGTWTIDRSPP